MASGLKNLSKYNENNIPRANKLTFGIVVSEWNDHITHALYEGCVNTLIKHGAKKDNIFTTQVPGAFELPVAARMIAASKNPDAVICLGCVIKGDTKHDEYICTAVAYGLMNLSTSSGKPFIFGLLTTNDEQQALDRAGGAHGNKGVEAAVTAIRMASLKYDFYETKNIIGF